VMDTDKRFLIRMAMTSVHGIPKDWTGCSPMVAALLDLANHPICAATDARAARCLVALGGRLPVSRTPKECVPGSVGVLLMDAPMALTPEWAETLADGAIVIIRGTEDRACAEQGAVNCVLDFEHGFSIGVRPGGLNEELRQFMATCAQDRMLAGAIVQMALVLQSRNAHVALASDALQQRDARIAMLSRPGTEPAPNHNPPTSDNEAMLSGGFANRTSAGSAPRKEPQYSRLRRRAIRLAKRLAKQLGLSQN
jgi:hypothetical protein